MSRVKDGLALFVIGLYASISPFLYFAVQAQSVEPVSQHVLTSKVVAQQTDKEELLSIAAHPFYAAGGLPDPNEIFNLVNTERQAQHLSILIPDGRLAKIAQERANDMARKGYFSHKSPDGHYYYDILGQALLSTSYSCENLAMAGNQDSQSYINQWLTSTDGHKECMLNPSVSHVGFGVAKLTFDHSKGYDTETYIVVAIHAD